MTFTGPSFIAAMSNIVSCPSCARPAFVEDRCHLDSANGLVEHLHASCINGHSTVQLADRVTYVSLPTIHQHLRSATLH